jgi:hypothetical protein
MLEKINNQIDPRNLNGLFEARREIRLVRYDMCEEFLVKIIKLIKK